MGDLMGYVNVATAVVTVASFVANLTKTDADNRAVAFVSKAVHFFAMNWFGEAAPK